MNMQEIVWIGTRVARGGRLSGFGGVFKATLVVEQQNFLYFRGGFGYECEPAFRQKRYLRPPWVDLSSRYFPSTMHSIIHQDRDDHTLSHINELGGFGYSLFGTWIGFAR